MHYVLYVPLTTRFYAMMRFEGRKGCTRLHGFTGCVVGAVEDRAIAYDALASNMVTARGSVQLW